MTSESFRDTVSVVNFLDPRLPERFWSKCIPEPNSGCWLWLGQLNHSGYGLFWNIDRGRMEKAHRVSFLSSGRIYPSDHVTDHLCRTRNCVNPLHMEAVTRQENTRRGDLSTCGNHHSTKTHCPHGHEYTPENTYTGHMSKRRGGRTYRMCATCNLAQQKRRYERKRDNGKV